MTEPGVPRGDLTRLIDTGPLGLVSTDVSGTIGFINTTLLTWLGYVSDDLLGARTFQQLLSPGGRIYFDTHVRPTLHVGGAMKEIALELVCADRSRLPVLVNIQRRGDGPHDSVEIVVFDATERRRYEKVLLQERRLAEQTTVQLQMLYAVVSGLATATTVSEVIDVVTKRGVETTVGASCGVWLFDPDDLVAVRISDSSKAPARVEIGSGVAALDELRHGRIIVIEDSHADERYPLLADWLRQADRRSALIAPMSINGYLAGVIAYGVDELHVFDDGEQRSVETLAIQTGEALSRARALDSDRQSRDRLEKLFRFSVSLSELTTVEEVLQSVIESSLSLLGAVGSRLSIVDVGKEIVIFDRSLGVASTMTDLSPFDQRTAACEVLRTFKPIATSTRAEYQARFPDSPLLDTEKFTRVIASPLRAGGGLSGVWSLILDDAALAEEDDTKLVQLFMEQAGNSLSRAFALAAEVAARQQADTRRRISEALNHAVTAADVGEALVVDGCQLLGADELAVFVVDGDKLRPAGHFGSVDGLLGAVERSSMWSSEDRRFRHEQPVFITGPEALRRDLDDIVDPEKWGSAALLPLYRDEAALGLILVLFHDENDMGLGDRQAMSSLSIEAGAALARARIYEIDRDVADTLQRSLLAPVPDVPGWRIDAAYQPGTGELIVGGDLYDVTTFPDGRLVVIVGDVVGHGLQAAAAMGQLRSGARALALVTERPEELLTALDEFARLTPGVMYASVFCVMFDANGAGMYACAGHPYPILVAADGGTTLLDEGRSPLLGVGDTVRAAATVEMEPGATLVAYTDGLIERRGTSMDDNLRQLCDDIASIDLARIDGSGRQVIDRMPDVEASHDDIVVVCVTRAG